MVSYFLGGAVMSAATSALYGAGGWGAVCVLGAATAGVGLVVWAVSERFSSPALATARPDA